MKFLILISICLIGFNNLAVASLQNLLDECNDWDDGNYRARPYLEAAIYFQHIDQKKAKDSLIHFSKIKSENGVSFRFGNQIIILCRMLFVNKLNNEFRRPRLGKPLFIIRRESSLPSLEPIEIVDGIPFLTVGGYELNGHAEPPISYVQYCLDNCEWNPFRYQLKSESEIKDAAGKFDSQNNQKVIVGPEIKLADKRLGLILLKGHYYGRNIFLQPNGTDECRYVRLFNRIRVNDEIAYINESGMSAEIEIDKTVEINDPVTIKIYHSSACPPIVLNAEVLNTKSTFETVDILVDSGGNLNWKTISESGKLDFIVEQFKWSKWVTIAEVASVGTKDTNVYFLNVSHWFHSGENKFRIKQVDYSGKARSSTATKIDSGLETVTFTRKKDDDKIIFFATTSYEIYNNRGDIVKKGRGSEINCTDLVAGTYYINFDNRNKEFIKK